MAHLKGIALIVLGAMFWGANGPMMQILFTEMGMSVSFLLAIRLLSAGIVLLVFLGLTKKPVFLVWKSKHWSRELVIFSVIGMLGIQYSFLATIHASNAVFATLIQFLGPIFIVGFVSLKCRTWPPRYQVLGILGTIIGLFLLLTNASLDSLLVSQEALIWGIIEGGAFAVYTLYPARLMKEFGVLVVVGWGMLIGGVIICVSTLIWESKEWMFFTDLETVLLLGFSVLFGTLGFVFFLSSMKYISPVLTSVLSSVEPLTAMILSILLFHTTLAGWQFVGAFIMLICVTWLSVGEKPGESHGN
ncbi:MAG: DMT family transporter [Bacillota bacterium]|nr:DMT family transporter [Bacillota bacterium]